MVLPLLVTYKELVGQESDDCELPNMYNVFTAIYTKVDAHACICLTTHVTPITILPYAVQFTDAPPF